MIVIAMAGASRRFFEKGYAEAKHRLPLNGRSVFDHAVDSFRRYFHVETFVFVFRGGTQEADFIQKSCAGLGVGRTQLVNLDALTAGQAQTVLAGLEQAGCEDRAPLTIFNIDTFRPGFHYPDESWFSRSDGYLEVMRATDPGFSFVLPDETQADPVVLETAEKKVISDLASTGLAVRATFVER